MQPHQEADTQTTLSRCPQDPAKRQGDAHHHHRTKPEGKRQPRTHTCTTTQKVSVTVRAEPEHSLENSTARGTVHRTRRATGAQQKATALHTQRREKTRGCSEGPPHARKATSESTHLATSEHSEGSALQSTARPRGMRPQKAPQEK